MKSDPSVLNSRARLRGLPDLNRHMGQGFEAEIASARREKDAYFRGDPDSPIPSSQRSRFKGLNYYPPDPAYKIPATLERFEKPDQVKIVTSKGSPQPYVKYGALIFELQEKNLKLFVYKSTEDPFSRSLFVPFSDATSGNETYNSGRYLDLEEQGGDDYDLDFNMAYNPYCAYNEDYICPIPPRENRLTVKILAGEKNYK